MLKLLKKFLIYILSIEVIIDIITFYSTIFKLLKNKLILLFTIIICIFVYISFFFNKCYSYSLSPLEKYYAKICYPDKYKFYHFLTKWSPRIIIIYQNWDMDNYFNVTTKAIYQSKVININDININWDLDNKKIIIDNKSLSVNFNEYCNEVFSRSCMEDYSYLDDYDINEVKKNKPYYTIEKYD